MLKKRKQCPCKPSSVFLHQICCYAVFISDIRMSVIYLVPKSPLGSSTLPSAAALRQSDEPPSICGIHELTAPRWHSLTITRQLVVSYTTFSPLPHTRRGGYFLLPTPAVADSFYFRKWGSLCCPDFPLLRLCAAATEPRHCFQQDAKLRKIAHIGQFSVIYLNKSRR